MKTKLKTLNFSFLILSTVLLIFSTLTLSAQEEVDKEKNWNFIAAPYLLFPTMSGEITVQGLPADASASTKDVYSNLNLGGMLYFEANNGQWAIILDGYYVDLEAEGVTPLLSRKATIEMNQLAVAIGGLYRINSWFEVGLGGRINSIGSTLTIAPGEYILPGSEFSMDETWFDPIITARAMTQLNESKWRFGVMTDFGGFGIGSKYAYQVNAFVGYELANWLEIDAAYRLDGKKYEKGSGTDLFVYDVILHGPSIGFVFKF